MVKLGEQSSPKPILYTVIDTIIRLTDNKVAFTPKPRFINQCVGINIIYFY